VVRGAVAVAGARCYLAFSYFIFTQSIFILAGKYYPNKYFFTRKIHKVIKLAIARWLFVFLFTQIERRTERA
jgi:hypothetical protein